MGRSDQECLILYQHAKTVPCRNYHSTTPPIACMHADRCNYIHAPEFINRDIPEVVLQTIRNKNKRDNMLSGVKAVFPKDADAME